MITTLIDAGAKLDARREDGFTPLHAAAANNSNPKIIATLLVAGAELESQPAEYEAPKTTAE